MGMGNLADELEFADEEEWDEDGSILDEGIGNMSMADELDRRSDVGHENTGHSEEQDRRISQDPAQPEGARDSGVDVEFKSSPAIPKFSNGPFRQSPKTQSRPPSSSYSVNGRPGSGAENAEEPFSLELEDAMSAIARLADPQHLQRSDTISRTLSAMQDLTPQANLETQTQRLVTNINSLTSNLLQQSRTLSSLSSSLFSPFAFTAPLDALDIDDIIPDIIEVIESMPFPDPRALQGLAKLDRETTDLVQTLAGLTDTLQMGKQVTSSAARQLRTTETMVTGLRRERERADEARWIIEKEGWEGKLAQRWCASECKDVVGGFETVCEGLRQGLENSVAA